MFVLIKGAGDLASGIACRLKIAGCSIIMTDIAVPTTVRRPVAFSPTVYEGSATVEGIEACLAHNKDEALQIVAEGKIAVIVDPMCEILKDISFGAVIDAILAKKNLSTKKTDAPIVIGVGPGFTAPIDCHAVIETARGHNLGRAIYEGEPKANTGIPGEIGGYTIERLVKSPCAGTFHPINKIGDIVKKGDIVATVDGQPVFSQLDGVLRGLLQEGVPVTAGMKSGDVDPRLVVEHCYTVSDKARSIAGGVLEALCHFFKLGGTI